MSDLITWLRAQLDEDERVAQKCAAVGDFRWAESEDPTEPDGRVVDGQGRVVVWDDGANLSGHIARHDPARVLAEVAAKRQLIESMVESMVETMEGDYAPWNEDYLMVLALPYADQPGYLEEWRP